MTGTVKDWFPGPGYGRIVGADRRVFFVHRSALRGVQDLALAQVVEFVAVATPRGPRAEDVRVCELAAPATPQ